MVTISLIPASAASMIAPDANFGGTATNEAFAPVAATASATELKTGMRVELVIEKLYEMDDTDVTVWKWKPVLE